MLSIICIGLSICAEPALTITSPVGTGEKGFGGDGGPASKATLNQPFDLAFDKSGNLYFSDTGNHRIRMVSAKSGIITTVAGNGKKGFGGDSGKATDAMLNEPYGIAIDDEGNLYIVDRLNYCIRKVEAATGIIATVAGTGGKSGFAGDGGLAVHALFVEPNGICLDGKGKLYVADAAGHRVRVVDLKKGTIDTLAGTGKASTNGDGGPLKDAAFSGPRAVAIGPDGSLSWSNGMVIVCERSISKSKPSNDSQGQVRKATLAMAAKRPKRLLMAQKRSTSIAMEMCISSIRKMRLFDASMPGLE
jgi:DNA-binding beta-propeller fold protein YncE